MKLEGWLVVHLYLKKLYNKGFSEKLEYWRSRISVPETKSDIYDGQVWKDFQIRQFTFTKEKSWCYGFFQPHKHVNESYGVIYLCIVNLLRGERFTQQQNVLIVGVIPACQITWIHFFKPLVAELQEFWKPGIRLYTSESPNFKVLFRIALMCVACEQGNAVVSKGIVQIWGVHDVFKFFQVQLAIQFLVVLIEKVGLSVNLSNIDQH